MKYPFFLSDYVTWGLPVIAGAWSQRTVGLPRGGGVRRQPAMRGPKMLVGDPGATNTSAPKASSSYAAVGVGKTNKQTGNRSAGMGSRGLGTFWGRLAGSFCSFFVLRPISSFFFYTLSVPGLFATDLLAGKVFLYLLYNLFD